MEKQVDNATDVSLCIELWAAIGHSQKKNLTKKNEKKKKPTKNVILQLFVLINRYAKNVGLIFCILINN